MIADILPAEKPKLYWNGRSVRDWIHVRDHAAAMWAILTRGRLGEAYPIGSDDERSKFEVPSAILREMGRDADDFEWVCDRPGHDCRYALDASKLTRELGWRPEHTDFETGLRETIAWYVENRDW